MTSLPADYYPPADLPRRRADRDPVMEPGQTAEGVTAAVADTVLRRRPGLPWLIGVALFGMGSMALVAGLSWLFLWGVGVWGIDMPVAWGFAIVNYVWWIGIGVAGTFISSFLLLTGQNWRTSINRFAEAMTLFAIAMATLFPVIHLGRPWLAYWTLPYPNTMWLWPQFRSPLIWDAFAVGIYGLVSAIFWYIGLIPDLATMRDRAVHPVLKKTYGLLALGWRNSARHWARYQIAYLLLAGLAAPLFVSVHSVVGLDFAAGQQPGWHSTIFPPYFVAGAIMSGFAMVLTLAIPLRAAYGFEGFITLRHLDNCAKLLLCTGLIVSYGYCAENFLAWFGNDPAEMHTAYNRFFGAFGPTYWLIIACNTITPQALWFKAVRTSPVVLFVIAIVVQVGMWTERFVIIVPSLQQGFLPGAWGSYSPTVWDWMILFGTVCAFFLMFLIFAKVLPSVCMFELRELVHETGGGSHAADSGPASPR